MSEKGIHLVSTDEMTGIQALEQNPYSNSLAIIGNRQDITSRDRTLPSKIL
ncbi:MAG: hypothetical protein RID09_25765 [Coleofasciculus sp. G1-WW12-02]|uniref:hypothetical protein n=1 Tax=Coleofasciculus sp. G1-WW12-02 TaxID=3068483 RepID=UPI0033044363